MSKDKSPQGPTAPAVVPWQMPSVRVGEFVLWSADGTESGMRPAIVTKVNPKCIDGAVMGQIGIQEGMRHVSDPRIANDPSQIAEFGLWKKSPVSDRWDAMEDALADLAARVSALEISR